MKITKIIILLIFTCMFQLSVCEYRSLRIRVIYLQEEFSNAGENMSDELLQHVKSLMEVSKQFFNDLLEIETHGNFYIEDWVNPSYGSIPDSHRLQDGQQESDYFFKSNIADDPENYCDMVIYVASLRNEDASFLVNASKLVGFSGIVNSRPKAGQLNINMANFNYQKDDPNHQAQFEFNLESIFHELFHLLGLSGTSSLPNDEWYEGGSNGQSIFIKSPKVLEVARNYFDDQSITKIPFENQGGAGSMGSHWERLLIKNEFMTASTISSDAAISALSLAFLEDTGMYQSVNHDMAEDCIYWGKGKGQQFIDAATSGDCGNDQYREFASNKKEDSCDFYHFGFGVYTQSTFSNNCYVVSMNSNTDCTNPAHQSTLSNRTYEKNGVHSKCFESDIGSSGQKYKCYQYYCKTPGVLTIQFMDGDQEYTTVDCTENEQEHTNPSGLQGTLKCPENIAEFCNYPAPCENYCSEKGYCLRKSVNNKMKSICHCIEGYGGPDCSVSIQSGQYVYFDYSLQEYIASSVSCEENNQDKFQYYEQNRFCELVQCDQSCYDNNQICQGITTTDCIDCNNENIFFQNKCIDNCPQEYFLKDNVCQQCEGPNQQTVNCLVGEFEQIGDQEIKQLQVKFESMDDQFRNVCSQGFNFNSAQVYCRQKGFKSFKNIQTNQICLNDQVGYTTSQVNCQGNEQNLNQCPIKFNFECEENQCVQIECTDDQYYEPQNLQVKSVDDDLALVQIEQQWGSICAHGLSQIELDIICKQYISEEGNNYETFNYDFIDQRFIECPQQILVSDIVCQQGSNSLEDCDKNIQNPECQQNSCLRIKCLKQKIEGENNQQTYSIGYVLRGITYSLIFYLGILIV